MRLIKLLFSFLLLLSVIGCASVQKPIPLSDNLFNEKNKRIGLIYTASPKAETVYTGNIGLLDYAIISGANEGLDAHLATLSFPEYNEFLDDISEDLKNKGIDLVVIDEPINHESAKDLKSPSEGVSKNDFSSYQSKYGLDMLMLINFKVIGTTRSYYGFIPTSEPMTQSVITGQLVDLSSNKLFWYSNSASLKNIPVPWDEAGQAYPNLTNMLYQSLDESFQKIKYELEGNTPLNVVTELTTE